MNRLTATADEIRKEGDAFLRDMLQLVELAHGLQFDVIVQELTLLQGSFTFFRDKEPVYGLDALRPLGVFWERLHPLNRWGGNFQHERRTTLFERNAWVD